MALKLYAPGERKGNKSYTVYGWWNKKPYEKSLETRDPEEAHTRFLELQVRLRRQKAANGAYTYGDADEDYRSVRQIEPGSDEAKMLDAIRKQIGTDTAAASISGSDLQRAAIHLYPRHANSTRNRMVIVPAAAILHAAADNQKIPWARYKRLKEDATAPRPATETAAKLLASNTADYKHLLMLALFNQGWRISEALAIEWEHIDVDAGMILHNNGKGNEWSRVPLHPEVLAALKQVPEAERTGRLFPWQTKSGVYKWLRPLVNKLGVKFTPHMARHSFATWTVDNGGDDHDLLATRNWRSLQSTRKYTKVSARRAREALGKLKGIS